MKLKFIPMSALFSLPPLKTPASVFLAALLCLLPGCTGNKKTGGYQVLHTPVPVTDYLGNPRTYRLYIPAAASNLPLIVYFHGVQSDCFKKNTALKNYTGSPVEETGLIPYCKLNQIALLVPDAKYEYDFLNCTCKGWSPFEKEIDGIEKIIDAAVKNFPVSEQEIYLAGISAGAVLCHHLANRRPGFYNSILSHSQGYIDENKNLLQPREKGPRFGVVFCFTKGDYKDLLPICTESEKIYRENGYKTVLLDNLPPANHSWSADSNRRFMRYLKLLGQFTPHP